MVEYIAVATLLAWIVTHFLSAGLYQMAKNHKKQLEVQLRELLADSAHNAWSKVRDKIALELKSVALMVAHDYKVMSCSPSAPTADNFGSDAQALNLARHQREKKMLERRLQEISKYEESPEEFRVQEIARLEAELKAAELSCARYRSFALMFSIGGREGR